MLDHRQILRNISECRDRIDAAMLRAGRRDRVELIGATKTQSSKLISFLNASGALTHVGENRVQELVDKYPYGDRLTWHMIGRLQTNKVKYVVDKAAMIHSLDRIALAQEIQKQADKRNLVVSCLIEVNMGSEISKGGIEPQELEAFACALRAFPNIKIRGLMSVMPKTDDVANLIAMYRRLQRLFQSLAEYTDDPQAVDTLSCGMTNDYEIAIAEGGATAVRLGRVLFGARE